MKALYYNGEKICTEDDCTDCGYELESALGTEFDELVDRFAENRYSKRELVDMSREGLEGDFWDALFTGSYCPDPALEVKEIEDDDEDEDEDEDEDDGLYAACVKVPQSKDVKIGYWTDNGVASLKMERIEKKTSAKCGCPVCDSELRVIGKLERMGRMPTLYASVCQGCGAHICFGSDEEVFFPLKEEEDDKE